MPLGDKRGNQLGSARLQGFGLIGDYQLLRGVGSSVHPQIINQGYPRDR